MKKRTLKLYSAVLSVTTLMSSLPILTSNAAEVSVNTQNQSSEISMVENESSTQFYGATGDRSLENGGIPESATVINSAYEYYQIAEQDNNTNEDELRMKADNDLPDSVDNSNSKYFPEVKSQGSIGSCVAWAETYYQFTYAMNKYMGVETTSDNTFSPKWTYNLANGGEDEGSVASDVYKIMQEQGNVPWSMVPYDDDYLSWSPVEDIWKTAIKYRIKDYQFFKDIGYEESSMITSPDDADLEPIKTALSNGDILTFSTHIRSWKTGTLKTNSNAPENSNYSGEEVVIAQNGSLGGHRMTIVGYNDNIWTDINNNNTVDAGEMGALKIANSWGPDYANDGFIWVSYDALNETTSVSNAENATNRSKPIRSVARMDVQPYDTGTDLYLKYTLNTSDRAQVKGYIIAEKDGTEYSSSVYPKVGFGQVGVYSYDGTTSSNDGTMIFALNNVIPDINPDNYNEYTWSVKFEDKKADSTVLTVKNAEIVDENANKTYKPENVYPFTLDGTDKTLEIAKTALNNAVIYYRGYENPYIHYKVGNGSWTSSAGTPMTENMERRGYTHKYVVDLTTSTQTTTFYFSDGNGNIDNNNGQYYTTGKGLSYYVTENVCEPLAVKLTNDFNSLADVDMCGNFYTETSGGYEPYEYEFTYEHLETGEKYVSDYHKNSKNSYYFREVGEYKVTVNVKDFADNIVSSSMIVNVQDFPFEFTELNVSPKDKILVGQELEFSAITNFEHIRTWGGLNNKYSFTIKKGNDVCYTTTVLANKCNIGDMSSTVLLSWTPTYSGNYSITISSTDGKSEYAEKTINFNVAEFNGTLVGDATNDKKVTIADAVVIMRYVVGLVDSSEIWLSLADCDNDGKVDLKDAVYIQKYILAVKNNSNVGNVNYKEPPTEPTTATEPITEPITEPPTEVKNIVTFTNSFYWSGTISCYYWSETDTSFTSWPGKAMTYAGTNGYGESMYTFEVPKEATYIIFTNGSAQTTDIPYPGGEIRYYPLTTTDSKGHNNVATW